MVLKGRSNKIFDLQFFHHPNLPLATWLSSSNFKFEKIDFPGVSPGYQTPTSQDPRREGGGGVSDPGEIDSLGYQTSGRLTLRGIRPLGD